MKKVTLCSILFSLAVLISLPVVKAQVPTAAYAKIMGGFNDESCRGLGTDIQGNIYVSGGFTASGDFDPGPGVTTLTSQDGPFAMYFCKLSPNGNLKWAKSWSGPQVGGFASGVTGVYGMGFDASNNIIVGGAYIHSIVFADGPNATSLVSAGGDDIFVAKLDPDGNVIWAKSFGGVATDNLQGLKVDASGNIYFTGGFNGTADFDPGVDVFNLVSNGSLEVYVAKLDADGNLLWAKPIGGTGADLCNALDLDAAGNTYTAISFSATVDFDPGVGIENRTSAGTLDACILKLNADGEFVFASAFGGTSTEFNRTVQLDASGNIICTGSFLGTGEFDPGVGVFNMTSAGSFDVYINKLDANGNFIWAKQIGGTLAEQSYSLLTGADNSVYVSGFFAGTTDFDPGVGEHFVTSAGSNDLFITKLSSDGDFIWNKTIGGLSGDQVQRTVWDINNNMILAGTSSSAVLDIDGILLNNTNPAGTSADVFFTKLCMNAPGNDNICSAQQLTLGAWTSFNNSCATVEAGEPVPPLVSSTGSQDGWLDENGQGVVVDHSIWFSFIAPNTGAVNIRSSFGEEPSNTQLALYSSNDYSCTGNLSLVSANDDADNTSTSSFISKAFCLEKGKKYFVQLDGHNGSFGMGSIQVIAVPNKATICHSTNGNNPVQITVSGCALQAHLNHGDVIGPCSGSRIINTDLELQSLTLYPNPATSTVKVSFESYQSELITIKIIDVMGRILLVQNQEAAEGSNNYDIDLSGMMPGIYSVSIISEQGNNTTLFVKQ